MAFILHAFDGHRDPAAQMLGATRTKLERVNRSKYDFPEFIFKSPVVKRGSHFHRRISVFAVANLF
jgi:hypothetical protein